MDDNFLYFTFNGISSEDYNCFYTNSGEDLKFPIYTNFTDQTNTPIFQDTNYYFGTYHDKRDIALNCYCYDLTIDDLRDLQNWLQEDETGELKLSFIGDYHFNVTISKFSDFLFYPKKVENSQNAEWKVSDISREKIDTTYTNTFDGSFTITFSTINDFDAISDKEYYFDTYAAGNKIINAGDKDKSQMYYELIDGDLVDYSFDSTTWSYNFINPCNSKYYITISAIDQETNIVGTISTSEGTSRAINNIDLVYNDQSTSWISYNDLEWDQLDENIKWNILIDSNKGYITRQYNNEGWNLIDKYANSQDDNFNNGKFSIKKGFNVSEDVPIISIISKIIKIDEEDVKGYIVSFDSTKKFTTTSSSDIEKNNDYVMIMHNKIGLFNTNKFIYYYTVSLSDDITKSKTIRMFVTDELYKAIKEIGQKDSSMATTAIEALKTKFAQDTDEYKIAQTAAELIEKYNDNIVGLNDLLNEYKEKLELNITNVRIESLFDVLEKYINAIALIIYNKAHPDDPITSVDLDLSKKDLKELFGYVQKTLKISQCPYTNIKFNFLDVEGSPIDHRVKFNLRNKI